MESLLKEHARTAVKASTDAYPVSKDPKDWKAYTETRVGDTLFLSFPGTCTWHSGDLRADLAFTTGPVDQSSFPVRSWRSCCGFLQEPYGAIASSVKSSTGTPCTAGSSRDPGARGFPFQVLSGSGFSTEKGVFTGRSSHEAYQSDRPLSWWCCRQSCHSQPACQVSFARSTDHYSEKELGLLGLTLPQILADKQSKLCPVSYRLAV